MPMVTLTRPTTPNATVPTLPENAFALTPADANDYTPGIHVYVGGAGVVRCTPLALGAQGTTVDVTVPAGGMVPFKVSRVLATGTTATLLIGVY